MHEAPKPDLDYGAHNEITPDQEVEFESWVPAYDERTTYYREQDHDGKDRWLGYIQDERDGTCTIWIYDDQCSIKVGSCSTESARDQLVSMLTKIEDSVVDL